MTKFTTPRRPSEFNEKAIAKALKAKGLYAMGKADGVRFQVVIAEDASEVVIYSRSGKTFRALGIITEALNSEIYRDYRVDLAGWTIECEAVLVDSNANLCTCAETSGSLQRVEQMGLNRLNLYLFDIHHPEKTKGHDLKERLGNYHQRQQAIRYLKAVSRNVFEVEVHEITSMDHLKEAYEAYRKGGWEGLVVTPKGVAYVHGKKAGAGWKMKPEETQEATITEIIEAVDEAGNPKGMAGSFKVTYEDGTEGVVGAGCMTHEERKLCWTYQDLYLGRLIEVKLMEDLSTGGKRHPVFKQWRDSIDDKGVKI